MCPVNKFQDFNDNQRQVYGRAVRTYEAYREAVRENWTFRGGMHWKTIKSRQYLYQYRDRYGHGQSMGPRSAVSEQILEEFIQSRQETRERFLLRRRQLSQEARFCRAAWIHRVPSIVTRILRRMEEHELLGQKMLVVGSSAIHAYEFAAGVFIAGPPANPVGPDGRGKLSLAAVVATPWDQIFTLLRRVDRSFETLSHRESAAANKNGFLVQVLPSTGFRPGPKTKAPGGTGVRLPGEAGHLSYLLSSPKFSQVVIGRDGWPAPMVAPDPRAFALHKLWLSQQAEREERNRIHDRLQALAVADLILRYLPQYHFFSAELRLFPEELVQQGAKPEGGLEMSCDFEIEY